jgi:hypothetical protein
MRNQGEESGTFNPANQPVLTSERIPQVSPLGIGFTQFQSGSTPPRNSLAARECDDEEGAITCEGVSMTMRERPGPSSGSQLRWRPAGGRTESPREEGWVASEALRPGRDDAASRENIRCVDGSVPFPAQGLFGYSYPMWIGWDWKKL